MLSIKLRQLRTKKGMTQQELASALNVSRSTIAGYEAESKQPSYEMIVKLSRYFKVSTDYLLNAGLFEPNTYKLVSLYRILIINQLYEYGYLSNNIRTKILKCPIDECIDFLSAYISDVTGDTSSIHYVIKEQIAKLGEKLYYTLTENQLNDLHYVRFDELAKTEEQANIIEYIENLPPEEQQKIRNYITMYHKLNPSVAAEESPKKTGTENLGK